MSTKPGKAQAQLRDLGRLGRWMDAEEVEVGAVTVASIDSTPVFDPDNTRVRS